MIKSHLLYQLSYGVNCFSFSDAKVAVIFEPAKKSQKKISAFFRKSQNATEQALAFALNLHL